MTKNAIGFVLIDAPHSALNNAGLDAGARTDNAVVVKAIKKGMKTFPYVSAQAWRYWWRQVLSEKFEWNMSPIKREKKVAFTNANPFEYPDDDIFGYMRAVKKEMGGTLTRLSPLKCSPLVAVSSTSIVNDFGVMARQTDGDPVPFEHQFYSTVLKGVFSLDITNVGKFYDVARTGYKNLDKAYVETDDVKKSIEEKQAENHEEYWLMPKENRVKRSKDAINALAHIYSTTKSAGHLTDVTPKFIILAVVEGGNHIFMNIANEDAENPININAIKSVIEDYKDVILSDIYVGKHEGFIPSMDEELLLLKDGIEDKTINISTPRKAIEHFTKTFDQYFS